MTACARLLPEPPPSLREGKSFWVQIPGNRAVVDSSRAPTPAVAAFSGTITGYCSAVTGSLPLWNTSNKLI